MRSSSSSMVCSRMAGLGLLDVTARRRAASVGHRVSCRTRAKLSLLRYAQHVQIVVGVYLIALHTYSHANFNRRGTVQMGKQVVLFCLGQAVVMAIRLNRSLVGNGYKLPVCRRLTQWKPGMRRTSGHSENKVTIYLRLQYRSAMPKISTWAASRGRLPIFSGVVCGDVPGFLGAAGN